MLGSQSKILVVILTPVNIELLSRQLISIPYYLIYF